MLFNDNMTSETLYVKTNSNFNAVCNQSNHKKLLINYLEFTEKDIKFIY